MRKIVVHMMLSLAGYFGGPDHDLSWHLVDEELHAHFNEQLATNSAFVEGRVSYELMEAVWPDRRPEPGLPADHAQVRRHLAGGAEGRVLPHAAGGRPQRLAAGRGGPRRDPRTEAAARRGHDARRGRPGRDLPPTGPGRRVPALRQPGRHRTRSTAVRDRRQPDRPGAGGEPAVRQRCRPAALRRPTALDDLS